jgi:hypothetical protein
MMHITSRSSSYLSAAIVIIAAVIIVSLLMLTGCGDESSNPASPTTTGNETSDQELADVATATAVYLGATTSSAAMVTAAGNAVATTTGMLDGTGPVGGGNPGEIDTLTMISCPLITYQTEAGSFAMQLDYGDGCVPDWGGSKTAGLVMVNATALDPGAQMAVTWVGYEVDGVTVDGTTSATLIGDTLTWLMSGTVSEGGAAVTGDVELAGTLVPNSPLDLEDDELILTGGGTVIADGVAVSFVIDEEEPLVLHASCEYPVSGDVSLSTNLGNARIDYGDGDCDSLATIWIGQFSWEVDLATVDLCELLDC